MDVANLPFFNPRKRRTREHVIADLSVNHVERQALLCGFSVERIRVDYGIDLIFRPTIVWEKWKMAAF
jgi:hypothetical protein